MSECASYVPRSVQLIINHKKQYIRIMLFKKVPAGPYGASDIIHHCHTNLVVIGRECQQLPEKTLIRTGCILIQGRNMLVIEVAWVFIQMIAAARHGKCGVGNKKENQADGTFAVGVHVVGFSSPPENDLGDDC